MDILKYDFSLNLVNNIKYINTLALQIHHKGFSFTYSLTLILMLELNIVYTYSSQTILILHITLSLYLPLFGFFLFSSSYYKFVTLFHFMLIFPTQKGYFLPPSLSLTLIFCWIFYEVCTPIVLLLTNLYVLFDASIFSYHFIYNTKQF